jgi:hypothetical protein
MSAILATFTHCRDPRDEPASSLNNSENIKSVKLAETVYKGWAMKVNSNFSSNITKQTNSMV